MISYTKSYTRVVVLSAAIATGTANNNVVDLSQPFIEDEAAMTTSPGAAKIIEVASSDPLIRAAVVLEDGKVVTKYYRDDVDDTLPNQVWSTTKSWTSFIIGMLVDDGVLSIDDTLGDIFTDESAWADVADNSTDFRKNVSIKDLLTMTSGLVTPPEEDMTQLMEMPPEDQAEAMASFDTSGPEVDAGGSSLSDSLAHPAIGKKGEFHYLGLNNILSYVIKERTGGMTPREYLSKNVLSKLGIKEDEYDWRQNTDMMEHAYAGLNLTALQMAKLPQLYLQGGKYKPSNTSNAASDDNQLISEDWINDSVKTHASDEFFQMDYGYLWWIPAPGMYCTIGAFGQDSCFDTNNNRVIVQQRDLDESNPFGGNLIIPTVAADPSLSFAAAPDDESMDDSSQGQEDSSGSTMTLTSVSSLLSPMLFLPLLL